MNAKFYCTKEECAGKEYQNIDIIDQTILDTEIHNRPGIIKTDRIPRRKVQEMV